jgi:hypothetical protein
MLRGHPEITGKEVENVISLPPCAVYVICDEGASP